MSLDLRLSLLVCFVLPKIFLISFILDICISKAYPWKADHSDLSNYRPIVLTPNINKVFESLLSLHFLKHLASRWSPIWFSHVEFYWRYLLLCYKCLVILSELLRGIVCRNPRYFLSCLVFIRCGIRVWSLSSPSAFPSHSILLFSPFSLISQVL